MSRSDSVASLAVRAAVVLTGAALVVVPAPLDSAGVLLTSVGVLLACVWPREIGSTVASAGFVIAWVEATGWNRIPSVPHTVAAAGVLYLFHLSCGLAAWVPIGARVEGAVVRQYLSRSVLPIGVAAAVIAIDLVLPNSSGSALIELVGLIGVLGAAGAVAYLLRAREG